jgi:hypothetical protein
MAGKAKAAVGVKNRNIAIMAALIDRGVLNYLQSKLISEIAAAVEQTDLISMKPYRSPPDELDYLMAIDLVFEYLLTHNLVQTMKCIRSESPSIVPRTTAKARLHQYLRVGSSGVRALRGLVHSWTTADSAAIVHQNHTQTADIIARRLAALKRRPQPRAATIKQPQPFSKAQSPFGQSAKRPPNNIDHDNLFPDADEPAAARTSTPAVVPRGPRTHDFSSGSDLDPEFLTRGRSPPKRIVAAPQAMRALQRLTGSSSDWDADLGSSGA